MAVEPRVAFGRSVEIRVLGPLEVCTAEAVLTPPSPKERALLAHLVVRARHTVGTDELIETLWGEHPPRTAGKALQNHVVRLRRLIEPAPDARPEILVTDPSGYRLEIPDEAIDSRRFESLSEIGRTAFRDGRMAAATDALSQALGLWRGRAYLGLESSPALGREARRLDDLRLRAIEDRVAADLDLGRAREVIGELESLVEVEPLRERLWWLLILALYRSDRQADSLSAYRRARDVLVEELGAEPGPALRGLQAQVLRQDPALDRPERSTALPGTLLRGPGPFVGRDAELAQLRIAWQCVLTGGGSAVTVLVTGPEGSGVTRLAAELAADFSDRGAPVEYLVGKSALVRPVDAPTLSIVELRLVAEDAAALTAGSAARGPRLVILLAREPRSDPVDLHLHLGPVGSADARTILAPYLGDELGEETVQEVLHSSEGWPGLIHAVGRARALEMAKARVTQAASRAQGFTRRLTDARTELREGVTDFREAVERAETVQPGACPWRGLAAYDVGDARWYFGRERLIAELISLVAVGRFVAVVGSSGSGKSSLLRAGLLASVVAGALPGSANWATMAIRPGQHPMRELRHAVSHGEGAEGDRVADLVERMIPTGGPTSRLLLVVDQFEEAWTACADPAERAAFLDALVEILESVDRCTLVVGVRADHVGYLADHPVLSRELVNGTLLVGSATPAEIRRMVEGPAERSGLVLDVGLVDAMVEDTGPEPGGLPLLSTALTEQWSFSHGRRLTLTAYMTGGGLRGAVARLAEGAYTALDDADRAAARVLLLRLAGPGTSGSVTRRRVPLAELAALPNSRVLAAVEPLAAARLLTVDADCVEVAHEALFREWPRLRAWLDEQTAERTIRRRLGAATADWVDAGRDPAEVWQGTSLAAGLELWASAPDELTIDEQAFLQAGRDRLDAERRHAEDQARDSARRNRRLRGLLAACAALLAVASGAGVLAVGAQDQARSAQVLAEQEAQVAQVRELAAAANAALPTDPELAVLLAERAVATGRQPAGGALAQAEEALHRAVVSSRVVDVLPGVGGSLALSPDGAVFVPEGPEESGQVEVHDARTGELLRSWQAHSVDLNDVTIGPDGTLVTTGDDGTAIAWDLLTGREIGRVSGPEPEEVWNPQISADGSVMAAGWSQSRTVRVHDLRTGRLMKAFTDLDRGWVLALNPEGTRIALAPEEGRLAVFDVRTGRRVLGLAGADNWAADLAWSPDGRLIAGSLDGKGGRIWDAATGELVAILAPGHTGYAPVVLWSPDAQTVATAGHDGTVRVWRRQGDDVEFVGSLSALSTRDGVLGAAFSPDSRLLYASGFDVESSVTVFDVSPAGSSEWATVASPADRTALAFAPDGQRLYVGSEAVAVRVVDPTTGRTVDSLGRTLEEARIGEQLTRELEVSVDGLVAAASEDGVRVLDPISGDEVFTYTPRDWWPSGLAWSPDGSLLAVAGHDDGGTVVLDVTGREVGRVQEEGSYFPISVAFSPDGTVLAVGRAPTDVQLGVWGITVWDWRARKALSVIDAEAQHLTFTQDGLLINADRRGPVLVSDPATGEAVARLTGHTGGTLSLDLSPDGTRLATVGRDGTVRIWETVNWTEQLALPGHNGSAISVRFNADGRRLATLGDEGMTRVWAIDLESLLRIAETKVTRTLSAEECLQYLHIKECA